MSEETRERKKEERKEIFRYVEVLIRTRMNNTKYPVQQKELLILTNYPENIIRTGLKWLLRHGVIERCGNTGYIPKIIPEKGFCWLHGRFFPGIPVCPKCQRAEQRQLERIIEKIRKRERREIDAEFIGKRTKDHNRGSNPRYRRSRIAKSIRERSYFVEERRGCIREIDPNNINPLEEE